MRSARTRHAGGGGGPIMVIPMTPVVKALLIINVVLWLLAVVVLQGMVLKNGDVFAWFGMIPQSVIFEFKLWQPFTYLFLHSAQLTHILFNMLLLWWVGSQIELTMGSKKFLTYYLVCGVGAGILYLLVVFGVYLFMPSMATVMHTPVVGASGAVFGLLLAFAIFHGEEVVYFMMLFPMKAKYFVCLLILIELFVISTSGLSGPVANLAHLGGIVVGFSYLMLQTHLKKRQKKRWFRKNGRNLRLVVDNDKDKNQTYH